MFRCLFCQHANPAGAKFCNECGSGLRLQPCERCDAINDRDAPQCHHCGIALAATEATDPALSAAPSGSARSTTTADVAVTAPTPSASPVETGGADALPTLFADVPNASAEPTEQRTSVDRAFEVLERDLATLDRLRPAVRSPASTSWSVARSHGQATSMLDHENDLSAVRLQPFWRVESRSLARSITAMAAAGVALAVAMAGYLYTLPPGTRGGVVLAALAQPLREVFDRAPINAPPPSVQSAEPAVAGSKATSFDGTAPAVDRTARITAPAASVVTAQQLAPSGDNAPAPAMAAPSRGAVLTNGDDRPAIAHKADDAGAGVLESKAADAAVPPADDTSADRTSPPAGTTRAASPATPPALATKADETARASQVSARTTKRYRDRTNAVRPPAVSPEIVDRTPITEMPASTAAMPAPVAGPCTASVAALGLCARGPDAARR